MVSVFTIRRLWLYAQQTSHPRAFHNGGEDGNPPFQLKICSFPPPGKIPPANFSLPHQRLILPPLNNKFLNNQDSSSLHSHHPIKKSTHCTRGKGLSRYPLKLFGELYPPSFQPFTQSFISNQRTISIQLDKPKNYQPFMIWTKRLKIITLLLLTGSILSN